MGVAVQGAILKSTKITLRKKVPSERWKDFDRIVVMGRKSFQPAHKTMVIFWFWRVEKCF